MPLAGDSGVTDAIWRRSKNDSPAGFPRTRAGSCCCGFDSCSGDPFATVARLQPVTSFINQLWPDLSSFVCKTSEESFREPRHELDRRLDNRQRTAACLARRFVALRRFGRVVHQIWGMEV